jgi:hypothetical protein
MPTTTRPPEYDQPVAPNGVPWAEAAQFERETRQGYLFERLGHALGRGNLDDARQYYLSLRFSLERYGQRGMAGSSGY